MASKRRTRVVVAGQTPPPPSGMHVMVKAALDHLGTDPDLDVLHLRCTFSARMEDHHRPAVGKLVEVARVVFRQVSIRARGRIDVTLYPVGGTSFSSTIRDILVLPVILLCSRRTVLHFHGAGHEDVWSERTWWMRAAARLYRLCDRAIVMTPYNRRGPDALGMSDVVVVPHQLEDMTSSASMQDPRPSRAIRFLYVGHLGDQRRTSELVAAFASVAADNPNVELHLVGRPVPPYTDDDLAAAVAASNAAGQIVVEPELLGDAKWQAFADASWFVFPSVFECESFGLVLAEALMFGLPVVLTDWRGNLDVVDETCDREVIDPGSSEFVPRVAEALRRAARRTEEGLGRSEANRQRYLEHYARPQDWGLRSALLAPPLVDDP